MLHYLADGRGVHVDFESRAPDDLMPETVGYGSSKSPRRRHKSAT